MINQKIDDESMDIVSATSVSYNRTPSHSHLIVMINGIRASEQDWIYAAKQFVKKYPDERADASTVWKEFTTSEGKKYYYNKVTKQSKWTIPEELKLARELAEREASQVAPTDGGVISHSSASRTAISTTAASTVVVSSVPNNASATPGVASSQTSPTPTILAVNPAFAPTSVAVNQSPITSVNTVLATAGGTNLQASSNSDGAEKKNSFDKLQNQPLETTKSMDGASVQDVEEPGKGETMPGSNVNQTV